VVPKGTEGIDAIFVFFKGFEGVLHAPRRDPGGDFSSVGGGMRGEKGEEEGSGEESVLIEFHIKMREFDAIGILFYLKNEGEHIYAHLHFSFEFIHHPNHYQLLARK